MQSNTEPVQWPPAEEARRDARTRGQSGLTGVGHGAVDREQQDLQLQRQVDD
jgi:hypothetical protein